MGNEVSQITRGIYISNALPPKSLEKLKQNKITHIVAILPKAQPRFENEGIIYKCVRNLSDKAESAEQMRSLLPEIIEFIHSARSNDPESNILVHCLQGISRSVTFVVAYLMVVTDEPWDKVLDQIRLKRKQANPNPQFQRVLFEFCKSEEKKKLQQKLSFDVQTEKSLFFN